MFCKIILDLVIMLLEKNEKRYIERVLICRENNTYTRTEKELGFHLVTNAKR